jgi:hypothetical protein
VYGLFARGPGTLTMMSSEGRIPINCLAVTALISPVRSPLPKLLKSRFLGFNGSGANMIRWLPGSRAGRGRARLAPGRSLTRPIPSQQGPLVSPFLACAL